MKTILTIVLCFIFVHLTIGQTSDSALNRFIYEWIDVPYRFGGTTKRGVDCSYLNLLLQKQVYGKKVPRTCREQWAASVRIKKSDLAIGDAVFFRSSKSPSGWHCGTYIGDNKFFHASGREDDIMISDLNDPHYSRRYKGAGRF